MPIAGADKQEITLANVIFRGAPVRPETLIESR